MTTFNRSTINPFSALLFNERVIKLIHHINILMAGLINAARCSLFVFVVVLSIFPLQQSFNSN